MALSNARRAALEPPPTKCPPPRRALRRRRRRRSTTSRRRVLADGGARDDGGARRLRVVLDARCLAPAVTDRPGFAERAARCYAELFAPGARARVAGALVELDGADGAVAADRASGAAGRCTSASPSCSASAPTARPIWCASAKEHARRNPLPLARRLARRPQPNPNDQVRERELHDAKEHTFRPEILPKVGPG